MEAQKSERSNTNTCCCVVVAENNTKALWRKIAAEKAISVTHECKECDWTTLSIVMSSISGGDIYLFIMWMRPSG
jgi:hypothetical protein